MTYTSSLPTSAHQARSRSSHNDMQGSCLDPLVVDHAATSQSVTDADPLVSDFVAWPLERNQEVYAGPTSNPPLCLPLLASSPRAQNLRAQNEHCSNCFG